MLFTLKRKPSFRYFSLTWNHLIILPKYLT